MSVDITMRVMVDNTVGNQWTICARAVHDASVVDRRRTTPLQRVGGARIPVRATSLVYAGKRRVRPQSTALITDISVHTSDGGNTPVGQAAMNNARKTL